MKLLLCCVEYDVSDFLKYDDDGDINLYDGCKKVVSTTVGDSTDDSSSFGFGETIRDNFNFRSGYFRSLQFILSSQTRLEIPKIIQMNLFKSN